MPHILDLCNQTDDAYATVGVYPELIKEAFFKAKISLKNPTDEQRKIALDSYFTEMDIIIQRD